MERIKVLSKKALCEAIKEGATIQWDIIPAKLVKMVNGLELSDLRHTYELTKSV